MTQYTFDHIHFFTLDPEGMAGYFESMLRAEVIRTDQGGKPRIDLKLGGANIFLLDVSGDPKAGAGPTHPHRGLDHFGLTVADIDKVCDELKAKGAKLTRGPETIPSRYPHRVHRGTGGRVDRTPGARRSYRVRMMVPVGPLFRSTRMG
jgi:lactoylglutathione lyase